MHGADMGLSDRMLETQSCLRVLASSVLGLQGSWPLNQLHPSCVASGAPGVEKHGVEASKLGFQSVLWPE